MRLCLVDSRWTSMSVLQHILNSQKLYFPRRSLACHSTWKARWRRNLTLRSSRRRFERLSKDQASLRPICSTTATSEGAGRKSHKSIKWYFINGNSFVCTVDQNTKRIVRLRSYSLSDESNIPASICQAALATSAVTTFFEPVRIGHRNFADGGLGANNPVDEVEGEAANIWCSESGDLKPLVKCFLSIGTGNPGITAFEDSLVKFLGQTVVDIATETEETENRFIAKWRKHYDENRYFRFNVDQGLQGIGLDEFKQEGAMESATKRYLVNQAQKNRVRDCIKNLELKESVYNMGFS